MGIALSALVAACGRSTSTREGDGQGGGLAGAGQGGSTGIGGHGEAGAKGGMPAGGSGGGSGGSSGASGGGGGGSSSLFVTQTRSEAIHKVDLLLMLDNSSTMTNKQRLLADAIPILVSRLITPACVDAQGSPNGAQADAQGNCAQGRPQFAPIRDLHVGIITSSLGDHGSGDACSDAQNAANQASGDAPSDYDDRAELLPHARPRAKLDDWNDSGFLVWDPRDQTVVNDPHPNLGASGTDPRAFTDALTTEAVAAGQRGCGYESSLEAWYRFLVDPEPVASMGNDGASSVRGPTNDVVLAERAAFLRPDSVLVIVMMSDENDCSIVDEDGLQGWLVGYKGGVGNFTWHMPRASSACAAPNDPCCRPCLMEPVPGCPDNATDPACSVGKELSSNEDSMNLRCFDQMRRFGVDLLYPTDRYVAALSKTDLTPRPGGATVQNPLFAGGPGTSPRLPEDVILMGLVGVPWQDLATEASLTGPGLEFMSAEELVANGRWDLILGAPGADPPLPPADPFMVESIEPRPPAQHPLLDAPVLPPTSTTSNPINGHEQAATATRDDLQFACIFPLVPPVSAADCGLDPVGCACNYDEADKQSPLCSGVTADQDGSQLFDRAYPGLRELEVLKGVGSSGVVTSICPKNVEAAGGSPANDPSYGYNPAISALVARLGRALGPRCLPRSLTPSASDPSRIDCTIVEASTPAGTPCDCAAAGRGEPLPPEAQAVTGLMREQGLCDGSATPCDGVCLCEVRQLDGDALAACQAGEAEPAGSAGFCYIDPAQGIGSEAAVADCPEGAKRDLRFAGSGVPAPGAATFLVCGGK